MIFGFDDYHHMIAKLVVFLLAIVTIIFFGTAYHALFKSISEGRFFSITFYIAILGSMVFTTFVVTLFT